MAGQLDQNSSVHNKEPSDCRILNTEGDGSTGEGQSDKPSSDSNVPATNTEMDESMPSIPDPTPDEKTMEEDNEESVECGFLVDRICTLPYQKATERGEVPFCAFSPISTEDLYLLRIQDCSDTTRHMLVPASKDDVFSTPGALKTLDEDQEPGNEDSMNYRVAIVAIARQIYSEEDKQLVVSVDPLLKKDKKKIQVVKFLTVDKFADFAFLGFDGNVSEFANNKCNDNFTKDNHPTTDHTQNQTKQPTCDEKRVASTPAVSINIKSPPKAPARRGRGGRRRMSRKSPQMPASSTPKQTHHPLSHQGQAFQTQFFSTNFQQMSSVNLTSDLPSDFTDALIKMEQNESQAQQFLAQGFQMPVPQGTDPSMYTQGSYMAANEVPIMQCPTAAGEVIVSTTEPGADVGAQQTNHDLITIAFDQLVGMSENLSSDNHPGEKSGRGGRRAGPGRKPGRKPLKARHPNQIDIVDDNAVFGQLTSEEAAPAAPKRRGRPPKNRVPVPFSGMDSENSNPGLEGELREDFENYEKRMKLQSMELQ